MNSPSNVTVRIATHVALLALAAGIVSPGHAAHAQGLGAPRDPAAVVRVDKAQTLIDPAAPALPGLARPARMAIARLAVGRLTGMPPDEFVGWHEAIPVDAAHFGAPVYLRPPGGCMVTPRDLEAMRHPLPLVQSTARTYGATLVLVYEVAQRAAGRTSPLTKADLPLLGRFLADARPIAEDAVIGAVLVDGRNGHVLASWVSGATKGRPKARNAGAAIASSSDAVDGVRRIAPAVARTLAELTGAAAAPNS